MPSSFQHFHPYYSQSALFFPLHFYLLSILVHGHFIWLVCFRKSLFQCHILQYVFCIGLVFQYVVFRQIHSYFYILFKIWRNVIISYQWIIITVPFSVSYEISSMHYLLHYIFITPWLFYCVCLKRGKHHVCYVCVCVCLFSQSIMYMHPNSHSIIHMQSALHIRGG